MNAAESSPQVKTPNRWGGGGGGAGEIDFKPSRQTKLPVVEESTKESTKASATKDVHYSFAVCYSYRRSGNFRVQKLSYDKFSCKNIFVETTPYRISVNSAY